MPQYWILDPRARTLEVRVLNGAGYSEPVTCADGDVSHPTLFPDLEIENARLWL